MCECLEPFSKPTREWFRHAFDAPTEVQREAWPVIRSGANTLVIAPTGSGKTLCAFLSAIDKLMTADPADHRGKAKGVRILYISPLKALAVDVAKNLEAPLNGIAAECATMGLPAPAIRVATRSGDTSPRERRAIATHPPDILVTTPESLYLILTSKARRILRTVDTVIVDEVHAIAGTKRGAHLALSLERLDDLITGGRQPGDEAKPSADAGHDDGTGRSETGDIGPAQRIGLSATVNPPAEAARFLGGSRPVTIVDPGERPDMDLKVVEPLADMRDLQSANVAHRAGGVDAERATAPHISGVTPAMRCLAERKGLVDGDSGTADSSAITGAAGDRTSGSIWPVVEASVLDEILAHRTTLVFVNSRGLAEKLTARLNDLYAERRGSGAPGPAADPTGAGLPGAPGGPGDKGSPEGREGFARHYDAVVGSTTMLVGSHGADDVIAMAHHGSVSKDRRKRIEERLKHGELRCVVATSSLELGIDMGSVDLVIQISPPLSVASGLQRVGRADHRVGGVSHALFYPLTREQIVGVAASIESMRAGDIEPLAVPRNPLDILAQQTVAAAAMDDLGPDDWYATVRRAAPFADLDRSMFDGVMGMMTGAYDTEDFSAFRPPLMWNRGIGNASRGDGGEGRRAGTAGNGGGLISARPGAQRLAVTSGGTIPDRGLYTVVLPEADAGKGQRRVGELDEEMVYESRVGDVITLGTSTWQIQEITRDRVVVTPAPGRTARLPFWHGEESGRDAGFGRAKGRFLREVAAGLIYSGHPRSGSPRGGELSATRTEGSRPTHLADATPTFTPPILRRLHADGLDDNAVGNLARLLSEQQSATGTVPSDTTIVVERCPDEEGDWRIIIHSPYGRRVHEPWSMAVTARLQQRYGFDGQAYAADDGIVIRIPDGVGEIPLRELLLFDPDELTRIVETRVGESVLYAARFRECAARSLFLPHTEPGRRVPLWQQRLRAAQLLNAARMRRNFPLLLETARECLQDVYDLDALRGLMNGLDAGTITLRETTTDTPSPFAENLLFGFVGSVMYQYDVPQAERGVRLLSMDPEVLEKLLGTTDMSTVLDPSVIAAVERELAGRTFWNDLAADDVVGRVTRYAKTHGPFTAGRMIADLKLDPAGAVHALDDLKERGELLAGHFVDMNGDGDGGTDATQWLHRDVFRRIRARSLAKAREEVEPVDPAAYQSFLLDRQGVGPVGGERHEGADGLMRVIEQLEGVVLPAGVWESSVFPARVSGYSPALLDELLAGGEIVWVGSKTGDTKASEPGLIAFHPADSILLRGMGTTAREKTGERDDPRGNREEAATPGETIPDAILSVLATGGAYHAPQLAAMTRERWRAANAGPVGGTGGMDGPVETVETVDPETGEIITMSSDTPGASDAGGGARPWSDTQFEEALWSLVWRGDVTNSSFVPVRALCAGSGRRTVRAPARSPRRRVRMPVARTPMSLGGLWSLADGTDLDDPGKSGVTPTSTAPSGVFSPIDAAAPERRALERVEILLDRYGVIAQPLVDKENIPGGFSALYPLLKRMEEHGRLVRGMFVRGFGAAQFAEKDTVDALRRMEPVPEPLPAASATDGGHMRSPVAVSVLDPANLYGSAIAWPAIPRGAAKPVRREGGVVVLVDGEPRVYASPKSKRLTVFDRKRSASHGMDSVEGLAAPSPEPSPGSSAPPASGGEARDGDVSRLCPAFAELAYVMRRGGPGTTTFADINGDPLAGRNPYTRILHQAGFTPVPQGMRLY